MADNGKKRSLAAAKIPKRRLHLRNVEEGVPDDGRVYDGVGSELRAARKERDEELRDVAERLHIRYAYLHAIEEGDFDQLPGTVYALGFVRTYAEHLNMDADEVVSRFKDDAEGLPLTTELSFLEPVQEGRMPRGTLIVLSILIAVTVYGVWYFFSSRDRQVIDVVPPVPDRLARALPQDQDQAMADLKGQIDADIEATAAGAEGGGELSAEAEDAGAASDPAASQSAGELPSNAEQSESSDSPATPENSDVSFIDQTASDQDSLLGDSDEPVRIPESYEPRIYGATEGGGHVTIRANADTWVQVQADETGGEVLLTRILHEGDEFWVPDRDDLVLMTGNAGALEVVLDGRTLGNLGDPGSVRRGVSLDPEDLRENFTP